MKNVVLLGLLVMAASACAFSEGAPNDEEENVGEVAEALIGRPSIVPEDEPVTMTGNVNILWWMPSGCDSTCTFTARVVYNGETSEAPPADVHWQGSKWAGSVRLPSLSGPSTASVEIKACRGTDCSSYSTPVVVRRCGILQPGEYLTTDAFIYSCDKQYRLYPQADGNLVFSQRPFTSAIWSTGRKAGANRLSMRTDGNLRWAEHTGSWTSVKWQSATSGHPGAQLMLGVYTPTLGVFGWNDAGHYVYFWAP